MHPPDRNNEDDSVGEICLAGQDLAELCMIEYGSFIRRIDLSFNVLVSLRGLHICADTLEELILDNNLLERVDFRADFPKLHTLSLNKNRITDLDTLMQELRSRVKNLRHLSLLGNPVCPDQLSSDMVGEKDYQIYRCHILYHLRNVRFLDYRPVLLSELKESRKLIYANVKIITTYSPLPNSPGYSYDNVSPTGSSTSQESRRLPRQHSESTSEAEGSDPGMSAADVVAVMGSSGHGSGGQGRSKSELVSKGKMGKRRFRYVGKNSEGNRFIRDADL